MNETVEDLVQGILDEMEMLGCRLVENKQKLALLDARSADAEIERLEDRIEEIEYASEEVYQLDKDLTEDILLKHLDVGQDAKDLNKVMDAIKADFEVNNLNKDVECTL